MTGESGNCQSYLQTHLCADVLPGRKGKVLGCALVGRVMQVSAMESAGLLCGAPAGMRPSKVAEGVHVAVSFRALD